MASTGRYAKPPQWWKHLRNYKRAFWKRERQGGKADVLSQWNDKEGAN
jgi:hypothetical protein